MKKQKDVTLSEKKCPNCKNVFTVGKKGFKKFCSQSCSTSYNNKLGINGRKRTNSVLKSVCMYCNSTYTTLKKNSSKFCSSKCSAQSISAEAYDKFIVGGEYYMRDNYSPRNFKNIFLEEQKYKCAICGMKNKWNDKELVFVMDHIDGNPANNVRNNIRLVCPNCDSQLPTYKSKNKNGGRYYRKQRRLNGKSS